MRRLARTLNAHLQPAGLVLLYATLRGLMILTNE